MQVLHKDLESLCSYIGIIRSIMYARRMMILWLEPDWFFCKPMFLDIPVVWLLCSPWEFMKTWWYGWYGTVVTPLNIYKGRHSTGYVVMLSGCCMWPFWLMYWPWFRLTVVGATSLIMLVTCHDSSLCSNSTSHYVCHMEDSDRNGKNDSVILLSKIWCNFFTELF